MFSGRFSLKLIASLITESVIEGKQKFKESKLAAEEALAKEQEAETQGGDLPKEEIELLESVVVEDDKQKPSKIIKAKPSKVKSKVKEEE